MVFITLKMWLLMALFVGSITLTCFFGLAFNDGKNQDGEIIIRKSTSAIWFTIGFLFLLFLLTGVTKGFIVVI